MSLLRYVQSLKNTCQQTLYSIERLNDYSKSEASNITEFYVQHYLYDFWGRVKTSTDIVALIINLVYELKLPDRDCSLENGQFSARLRSTYPNNAAIDKMAKDIDRTRNWLSQFDKLRDIMVHKSGFEYSLVGGQKFPIHIKIAWPKEITEDNYIEYDPRYPLDTLKKHKNEDMLLDLLSKLNSNCISEYLITVDPLCLCNEIWQISAKTLNELLSNCEDQILKFMVESKSS